MKFFERIEDILFANNDEITEEVIQYYEKNPDELDLIIDREHFNGVYLQFIFFLGLSITILARVVEHYSGSFLGGFLKSTLFDAISEIGNALFGGAVVAYLIENLNKKQYQQNIKFRRDIKIILEKRKAQRENS